VVAVVARSGGELDRPLEMPEVGVLFHGSGYSPRMLTAQTLTGSIVTTTRDSPSPS